VTLRPYACRSTALLFASLLCACQAPAQAAKKPALPPVNLNLIVLDAGHGGDDSGANFGDLAEKDITIAFAIRLRPILEQHGFTVILAREPDPLPNTTEDQRAEIANRTHPLACLLLHATQSGHGVHLFTSALTPPDSRDAARDEGRAALAWGQAQAAKVPQSLRLTADLSAALNASSLPILIGRASVPPIDSLTCPAVAIELAPLAQAVGRILEPGDLDYQMQVAQSLTTGLLNWRGHMELDLTHALAAAEAAAKAAEPAKKPEPKPKAVQKPVPPDIPGDAQ